MTDSTRRRVGSQQQDRKKVCPRRFEAVLLGVLVAIVGWFYVWTAFPISRGPIWAKDSPGYYNLQARGFLKGKLSLDVKADPFLATLKNPWDPAQRAGHGMHDATYYKGEYHMYFGVAPVLMAFLPVQLLSGGTAISESAAVVLFCLVGFATALIVLKRVRRRYFPGVSTYWMLLCGAALGLATMVPPMLRRPSIWEVPISAAYLSVTFGLYALFRALHSRNRLFWLGLASFSIGCAVGARPVYLFACAALLPAVWRLYRRKGSEVADTRWRAALAAAVLPAATIGVGLALYNYLRFHSVMEFGQRYQMSGDDVTKLTLFSWDYPMYGVKLYLLAAAGWSPYFPFVTVINMPPPPPGQLGVENPYGILPNIPFVWMTLGLIVVFIGTWRRRKTALGAFVVSVLLAAILTMCTVMSFGGVTNRYQVDFVPTIVLASCVSTMALFSMPSLGGWARRMIAVLVSGLIGFSILFNVLVSLQHNNLLRAENPELYRKVATRANSITHAWDRMVHAKYGPLEMKVVFAPGTPGTIEGFVATGTSFRADYIYVHYLGNNSVRFGFEHTSYGGTVGEPLQIELGREYTIRVDMGSLYPPEAHPFFLGMPVAQARAIQRTLMVTVDDKVVLKASSDFYDATSRMPTIGHTGARPGFKTPFSGKIVSTRRAPELMPTPPPIAYGPVQLRFKLPPFTGVRNEPLLCSGESGKGDLIYVRLESETEISLGHDNWGGGGRSSEKISVDPAAEHVLDIDFAALYPAGADPHWKHPANREKLILKLDGKTVFDAPAPAHAAAPDTVVAGANPIGASSASGVFSGTILSVQRITP